MSLADIGSWIFQALIVAGVLAWWWYSRKRKQEEAVKQPEIVKELPKEQERVQVNVQVNTWEREK